MYYKKIAPGKFVKSRVVKFPPSKLPLLVLLPVLALAQGGSKPPAEQSELAKRARSADPESGEWRRAEGMPPGAEFLPLTQDHGSGRTEFLIRFPKGYGVGVARAAVASQGFIGHLGDVRTSHHHRNARRAYGVRHAIGLRRHPRHGANPHQPDVIFPHVLH